MAETRDGGGELCRWSGSTAGMRTQLEVPTEHTNQTRAASSNQKARRPSCRRLATCKILIALVTLVEAVRLARASETVPGLSGQISSNGDELDRIFESMPRPNLQQAQRKECKPLEVCPLDINNGAPPSRAAGPPARKLRASGNENGELLPKAPLDAFGNSLFKEEAEQSQHKQQQQAPQSKQNGFHAHQAKQSNEQPAKPLATATNETFETYRLMNNPTASWNDLLLPAADASTLGTGMFQQMQQHNQHQNQFQPRQPVKNQPHGPKSELLISFEQPSDSQHLRDPVSALASSQMLKLCSCTCQTMGPAGQEDGRHPASPQPAPPPQTRPPPPYTPPPHTHPYTHAPPAQTLRPTLGPTVGPIIPTDSRPTSSGGAGGGGGSSPRECNEDDDSDECYTQKTTATPTWLPPVTALPPWLPPGGGGGGGGGGPSKVPPTNMTSTTTTTTAAELPTLQTDAQTVRPSDGDDDDDMVTIAPTSTTSTSAPTRATITFAPTTFSPTATSQTNASNSTTATTSGAANGQLLSAEGCEQVQWVKPNKTVYASARIVWDVDRANQNYFLCQNELSGELIPGKTHGFSCKISQEGRAYEAHNFKVLTKPERVNLAWVQRNSNSFGRTNFPVIGGLSKKGDPYIVSRCLVKDENNDVITLIGYINNQGVGWFPFDDIQIECSQYDVLACIN